jgi:glycosyltransferase involved in cell wall biosynthesis
MAMAEQTTRDDVISIVVPAHNEEPGLEEFVRRVEGVMTGAGLRFEIVLVNDGSTDGTLAEMRRLRSKNDTITIVNLSRNFGKEIAMTAGIAHARGDALVIIDADLQDPPELIPEMVATWREGYDTVYAQRITREGESWFKKFTARAFYRTVAAMGPAPIPPNVGDFRLISRRVADALLRLPEQHRFMKGLYAWVGFPHKAITFNRDVRFAGATKWNYWKLWNLALEGITSFTIAPLKIATYLGLTVAAYAFAYGAYIVIRTLIMGDPVPGFPTVIVTVLFLGGVQLIVLGLLGEYIGRVFNETKRRPLYLTESVTWADIGVKAKKVRRGAYRFRPRG